MKELSKEEKAKRYDEAKKIAKSKIKNDKDHVLYEDDVIEIFPELKESEDERIRKALLHLISEQDGFLTSINGISVKDIIAWLEKQGEKETDDNDIKEALRTEYEKGRADAIAEVQKSAWSEEDERLLNDTLDILSSYYSSADDVVLCDNINKAGNWLESIKYRVQPQTKQEWSEEDEKIK